MKKMFDVENVEVVKNQIKTGLKFPYLNIYHSTLGGKENISILLCVSLDNRETWANGILQNSAYMKLHILNFGKIYMICRDRKVKKFRKCNFKNIDDLIEKLNSKIIKEII